MIPNSAKEIAKTLKTRLEIYEASGLGAEVQIGDCKLCKLCETRKNIVFGAGNPNADLVFVCIYCYRWRRSSGA